MGNINIENPLNGFLGLEEVDPFPQITLKGPAEFKEIYREIIFSKVAKQLVLNGD
ncbi:hypothetical protein P872_09595 [Rhodonellum psychrophilum GCM71 = DSM 17998]|uniref:Uncharacterized protein n=1 Tax=Rhodonellum psychrophilum GCM71 = DSM 17998 TaxID=1123057 RepID=U5BV13_9BACT|nr:hypothetical protein P872_09595 [Rhodonellum psychrophilum GCM71 = DSM 17998]